MSNKSSKNTAKLVLQLAEVKSASDLVQVYNQINIPSVDESAVALFYIANLPDYDSHAKKIIDTTLDQVDKMETSVISSVVKSLSLLKARNIYHISKQQIYDIMQYIDEHITEFESSVLVNLCYQIADLCDDKSLGQKIATSIVSELLERKIIFTKESIMNLLMVVAKYQVDCYLDSIQENIENLLKQMKSSEIAQIIWALSEISYQDFQFINKLHNNLKLDELSGSELGNLFMSYALLDPRNKKYAKEIIKELKKGDLLLDLASYTNI